MSKRRFLQIHLSTAVVLMLVAGVLVWANVRDNSTEHFPGEGNPEVERLTVRVYGWPIMFGWEQHFFRGTEEFQWRGRGGFTWFRGGLECDILFALWILLLTRYLCEWRIRRRAARKANE